MAIDDPAVARDTGAHWSTRDRDGRPVVASEPVSLRAVSALGDVERLAPNVEVGAVQRPGAGWRVDDRCSVVGRESPGAAEPDGCFAAATQAVWAYAMADPSIVRACWFAGEPLAGRRMVLEGRFGPLRFAMPILVHEVVDRVVTLGRRQVHVAGWSYLTLEGHLERGLMEWSVWKWLDTGVVEFRAHAASRGAVIDNPVVALGMVVFGRAMQVLSHRRALQRLRELVGVADRGDVGGMCSLVEPITLHRLPPERAPSEPRVSPE